MRLSLVVSLVLPILLFGVASVDAQVRSSSNYQIQSDSINMGGGLSTSTSYSLESTAGEVATGESSSASYRLKAGYQQMQEVYLTLSAAADVTMYSSISGLTGGSSNGSTTVTATTDSAAGYQLSIQASEAPAMRSGANTIADYVPAAAAPDVQFTFGTTESLFAFSPFGTDVVEQFQTNGSACSVSGSASTTACWDGLSTSPVVIAQRTSANQPDGTDTTIYFKVGIGSSVNQPPGVYTATTTLTLLSL